MTYTEWYSQFSKTCNRERSTGIGDKACNNSFVEVQSLTFHFSCPGQEEWVVA